MYVSNATKKSSSAQININKMGGATVSVNKNGGWQSAWSIAKDLASWPVEG